MKDVTNFSFLTSLSFTIFIFHLFLNVLNSMTGLEAKRQSVSTQTVFQDYIDQLDDHTTQTYDMTHGFEPFEVLPLLCIGG